MVEKDAPQLIIEITEFELKRRTNTIGNHQVLMDGSYQTSNDMVYMMDNGVVGGGAGGIG